MGGQQRRVGSKWRNRRCKTSGDKLKEDVGGRGPGTKEGQIYPERHQHNKTGNQGGQETQVKQRGGKLGGRETRGPLIGRRQSW